MSYELPETGGAVEFSLLHFPLSFEFHPMASLPRSPVLIRIHSSIGRTKILPSPMYPVRAPAMMPSTVFYTNSSFTPIARRTFL